MSKLGINLAEYQQGGGSNPLFDTAQTTPEALSELSKALEATSLTGREVTDSATASGAALKVESLDKNLKHITFRESDIRFWKKIPKGKAYNTVEEYNQLSSYGNEALGAFTAEGELPEEEDSQYIRRAQHVKFLGVTKSVTHQMQLVNIHIGNIIQREINNGTLYILRKADRALFYGDDRYVPQEFNGMYAQHETNDAFTTLDNYLNSEIVIDLRGRYIREDDMQGAAEAIIRNFGQPNCFVAPPIVMTDFVKQYQDSKFIQPNTAQTTNSVIGMNVQKFQSQYGAIDLEYDIFGSKAQSNPPKKTIDGATSSKAPSAPVVGGTPVAAVATDALSRFAAADAGDYGYAVAAVNRYGTSAITPLGTVVSVAAGGSADIQFTTGGGSFPATAFIVYRTEVGADATPANNTYYPVYKITPSELANGYDGAAAGFVRDRNKWLPNTEEAMLLEHSVNVYEFKQLAPLMKMDLAVLSPAHRFMILMYGTPFLYAPKKMVRFINIGRN